MFSTRGELQKKCSPLTVAVFELTVQIFYGCVDRALQNAGKQPIYFYQLDVKWKMFHEDPHRGESKNDQISRLEFCRSDHGDDLMVIFGEEFIKGS